jgi:hypothetical protein
MPRGVDDVGAGEMTGLVPFWVSLPLLIKRDGDRRAYTIGRWVKFQGDG